MLSRSAVQNPVTGFMLSSKVRKEHESVPENTADVSYLRNLRVKKDLKQLEENNNRVVKLNVSHDTERMRTILVRDNGADRCGNKSDSKPWRTIRMSSMMMISAASVCLLHQYGAFCSENSIRRRLPLDTGRVDSDGKTYTVHHSDEKNDGSDEKTDVSTCYYSDDTFDDGYQGSSESQIGKSRLNIKYNKKKKRKISHSPLGLEQKESKQLKDESKQTGKSPPKKPQPDEKTAISCKTMCVTGMSAIVGAGIVASFTHLSDIKHDMKADDIEAAKAVKEVDPITDVSDPRYYEQISKQITEIAGWVKPEMNADGSTMDSYFTTIGWARMDAFIGIVSMMSVIITFVGWLVSCSRWAESRNALRAVSKEIKEMKDENSKMSMRSATPPQWLRQWNNSNTETSATDTALRQLANKVSNTAATQTSAAVQVHGITLQPSAGSR